MRKSYRGKELPFRILVRIVMEMEGGLKWADLLIKRFGWLEFKPPHTTECLSLDDETVSNPWATIFMIAPINFGVD